MLRRTRGLRMLAVALLWGAAGLAAAAPPAVSDNELFEQLIDVLGTGDQVAYESFVRKHYAPAALAEYSAQDQAASWARIYTDTGGFAVERILRETPDWVQADARALITNVRYCLTLKRSKVDGRHFVTDFSARDSYPAGPQLKTPTPDEVVRSVETLVDKYVAHDLLSGVILIAKDENVIFRKAYGKASVAYNAPMTLETRLNIASIGKRFTGVAIAQLVDAGKMSFDDTVGKVWPDYPDKEVRDRVTIRQLLTHTSGLGPQDYYDHPRYPALVSRIRSVPDYMKLVVGTPLGNEPGKYLYSNSGYILLGAIIERLSGESYYDYVARHIFEPAGMKRSLYAASDDETPDKATPLSNFFTRGETAYIYRLGRPRNTTLEGPPVGGPQGGAWVTADDLFAFEKAWRAGKLVSAAMLEEMNTPQSPSGAGAAGLMGDVREGLGIEVIRHNGHTILGHTGGDFGVASISYWFPDTGYTTIILSNRDPRAVRVMTNATRGLLARETINGAVPPAQGCVAPAGS